MGLKLFYRLQEKLLLIDWISILKNIYFIITVSIFRTVSNKNKILGSKNGNCFSFCCDKILSKFKDKKIKLKNPFFKIRNVLQRSNATIIKFCPRGFFFREDDNLIQKDFVPSEGYGKSLENTYAAQMQTMYSRLDQRASE